MWGLERKPSRFARDLDLGDVHDQLDALHGFVQELSRDVGQDARSSYGRARDMAAEAARDAEETMKDNLAASLLLALGLGVAVGYFISRGRK
ncbi:MAG: hypothetical protein KAX78_06410 [Phycisphaerae bacterium]|nr:hypothetical protein [Phycisphaerae bacterium]